MNVQALGKISKRRIDQVAMAGTVAIAAALAEGVIGRGVSALRHVKSQESTLVERLDYLNEVQAMLGEGAETLTFLQERTQLLNERLPESMGYQAFYAEFAGLAERHGVELLEVQQREFHTEPDYLELPIDVEATATYEDLYAFLHDLNKMDRLVRVHSMEVGQSETFPICAVKADLRIYAVNMANDDG